MGFVVVAQVVTQAPVERFLNALGSGVALGAIYAMLALGFVIIFKATQVVNFAHGGLAALGAYLVSYFATVSNIPGRWMGDISVTLQWTLSALLALAVMAFIGVVIERITIRPMIGEPLFAVAMITLGLDLVIRTTTNDLMNNTNQGLGDPWGVLVVKIGFFRIAQTQIVAIVVLLLVGLLLARFFKTRTGLALRATAFDQEVAMAQGISVGKVFAIAWGIGAALAAIGGIFSSVAPRGAGVDPFTALIAFRAFPAIIIGGLDSIKGAVVGGLIVGVAEVLAGTYLGGVAWLGIGFGGVVPWLLMMVVLLVRPYGLFGTPEIRRV